MQIVYSQNKYRRVILIFRNYHNFIDWHIYFFFFSFAFSTCLNWNKFFVVAVFSPHGIIFSNIVRHNSIPSINTLFHVKHFRQLQNKSTHFSFLLNIMTWLKWIKRWNNCEKKVHTQKCIKQIWFNLTFHSARKSLADFRLFDRTTNAKS